MKIADIVLLRTLLNAEGFKTKLTNTLLKVKYANKSGGIFLSTDKNVMEVFNGIKWAYCR